MNRYPSNKNHSQRFFFYLAIWFAGLAGLYFYGADLVSLF